MSQVSTQIKSSTIPSEIKGWNWGAFLLNWIWGLGNKTYIALLALIPGINLIMAFILGAKGNQWAWKNQKWESIEHFKRAQKQWSVFGWGMLVGFLFGAAVIILIVAYVVSNVFF